MENTFLYTQIFPWKNPSTFHFDTYLIGFQKVKAEGFGEQTLHKPFTNHSYCIIRVGGAKRPPTRGAGKH